MTVKQHFTNAPLVTQITDVQVNTQPPFAVLPTMDGVVAFPGGEDTHVVVIDGVEVAWASGQDRAWEIYREMLEAEREHFSREWNR